MPILRPGAAGATRAGSVAPAGQATVRAASSGAGQNRPSRPRAGTALPAGETAPPLPAGRRRECPVRPGPPGMRPRWPAGQPRGGVRAHQAVRDPAEPAGTSTRSRILRWHRGNRSTTSKAHRSQQWTRITCARKEGGRRRGGERRPRARSGPGGEAGSVLIGKLICKVPCTRPQMSFFPTLWRIRHRFTSQRQPIELEHMPMGLRRVYREIATAK